MNHSESAIKTMDTESAAVWHQVCLYEDLAPFAGVTVVYGQHQIALFLLKGVDDTPERLYAVSNHDPFSGANVIGRGIVGDIDGVPAVASPLYKQHFRLEDGLCIEFPDVALVTWPVRLNGGWVEIQADQACGCGSGKLASGSNR